MLADNEIRITINNINGLTADIDNLMEETNYDEALNIITDSQEKLIAIRQLAINVGLTDKEKQIDKYIQIFETRISDCKFGPTSDYIENAKSNIEELTETAKEKMKEQKPKKSPIRKKLIKVSDIAFEASEHLSEIKADFPDDIKLIKEWEEWFKEKRRITDEIITQVLEWDKPGPMEISEIGYSSRSRSAPPSIEYRNFPSELSKSYENKGHIGAGGFGDVYKVKNKETKNIVALKITTKVDKATRKVFMREVSVWERLSHDNIVKLYDFDFAPMPHIEMEYCDGNSLFEMKKPISVVDACSLIFDICDGLKHAHSKKIYHRDLKPQNILFSGKIPKIADWGLSKVADKVGMGSGGPTYSVHYATPEVLLQNPCDARSDIFQIGLILYELVTGHGALSGNAVKDLETIEKKSFDSVEKYNVRAKNLEPIILKCLELEKTDRYMNISELQKVLAEVLGIEYQETKDKSLKVGDPNYILAARAIKVAIEGNLSLWNLSAIYIWENDLKGFCYANENLHKELDKVFSDLKLLMKRKKKYDEEFTIQFKVVLHNIVTEACKGNQTDKER